MSILEFDPWLRLDYAFDVTTKMRNANNLSEMATVFTDSIRFELDKDKKYQYGSSRACDFERDDGLIQSMIRGGVEEQYRAEYLISELVVAHMCSVPTPGEKKRHEWPSFAFLLAGLSALSTDSRIDENIRNIVRSAYVLAWDLVTAAIAASHADTLRDMERGIRAVQEHKNSSFFSQHVFACLMAHRRLIQGGCERPTKGLVRDGATEILKGGSTTVSKDCARWREVFRVAGFENLPQERPGRIKRNR